MNVPLGLFGLKIARYKKTPVGSTGGEKVARIGRFDLFAPASSNIPETYAYDPQYSSQLGRLAAQVYIEYPSAVMVDVGANVGDTAAMVRNQTSIPILCIEGDDTIFRYLAENISQLGQVTAYKGYLGERCETLSVRIEKEGFNTTLVPSEARDARLVSVNTLDGVAAKCLPNRSIKLLKIDTEGFDTAILRGAINVLKSHRPVVSFEYNRENMAAINEDGLCTLKLLQELGYETALFYESTGRFVVEASLRSEGVIRDLHEYADGFRSAVYYFDICAFHELDRSLARRFVAGEREFRARFSGPK